MTKWIIENTGNKNSEKKDWDVNYKKFKYEDVWSITEDKTICEKLTSHISSNTQKILIPGCGSKTYLQEYIRNISDAEIYCCDWSKSALQYAAKTYSDKKLFYIEDDMKAMQFSENSFDLIIICNSILSGNDTENRKMISECNRVLRPRGHMTGLFPSVYATYEISYLDDTFSHWRHRNIIDIEKNTFYEETQNLHQIFYTPIRLRHILKSSGFHISSFEILFCDTDHLQKENERIYKIPRNSDLMIWEFLVTVQVP